jgi:hypothetical protein
MESLLLLLLLLLPELLDELPPDHWLGRCWPVYPGGGDEAE